MDFGTRRRFSREVQETIVKVCNRNPGSWAPATTIWRVGFPHANGNTSTRMVPGASANQSDLANSQRAALAAWLEEYPDNLALH